MHTSSKLFYPVAGPVFADADYQAEIIGHAALATEAEVIYRGYFGGTGEARAIKAVKAVPDRRGEGPVDGWVPAFTRTAVATIAALALSGCATLVEGTSQDLHMNVTPERAACTAYQKGQAVGAYDRATSMMTVSKSRADLTIVCRADGYRQKTVTLVSNASAWGVAGALTIDFGIVDYATGALNKYDSTITIVMEQV